MRKRHYKKRSHHASNFTKPSAPNFSRLRRACSTLFSVSRRVLEKNLSAKQIICSSILCGCISLRGSGKRCCTICCKVSPVPVWRSHTKA